MRTVTRPIPPQVTGAKTFRQWSSEGYRIRRGAKARQWTADGLAKFDESQVYLPRSYSDAYGDDSYERDSEEGFCMGISPWGSDF
jgi:hypothetical protein